MDSRRYCIVGLMSGSSLDGVDLAACEFTIDPTAEGISPLQEWHLLMAETLPFSEEWRQILPKMVDATALDLALTHTRFGRYLGELAADFIRRHGLTPDAVCSHGHTIFHFPEDGMTWQIGDGAALSAQVGCTVINDLRSMDVALGGQGAPLAALADKYLFSEYEGCLNLGGIVNLSWKAGKRYVAFDITGVNQIMNALVQPRGLAFDEGGKLAATGKVNEALLDLLNDQAFFELPYPKSLDNRWVQKHLTDPCLAFDAPVEDKLHTVCRHVAVQITQHIHEIFQREGLHMSHCRIMAAGGGALNDFLIACIRESLITLGSFEVVIPPREIIEFKEAIFIGLMGALRMERLPNCVASATGASRDAIGGAIYG